MTNTPNKKLNLIIGLAGIVFLLIASGVSWMVSSVSAEPSFSTGPETLIIKMTPGFDYGSAVCQIGESKDQIPSSSHTQLKTALQSAIGQKTSAVIQASANVEFKQVHLVCQTIQSLTASNPAFVTRITNVPPVEQEKK